MLTTEAALSAGAVHGSGAGRRRGTTALVFAVFTVAYASLGMVLSLHYNLVDGDGPSRVANAGYITFSRYPHLGAVGFVWNPLPSMVEVPLLQLQWLWPPLKTYGQAGTIQSALFMAAAVVQIRRITLDRELPGPACWVLTGAFALNPMIVMFGGNGLSEAAMLFCMTWAARRLMLWLRTPDLHHLIFAGVALAMGYLTRYETLAAAGGVAALVAVLSAWRERRAGTGFGRLNLNAAIHDGTVLLFPVLLSVAVWTFADWLLTGELFSQLSSQYGNSAITKAARVDEQVTLGPEVRAVLRSIVSLQPLLPVILVLGLAFAVHRRAAYRAAPEVLAPVVVFGSMLVFMAAAQIKGLTFGWFRFYLTAVPLAICVVATLWQPAPARGRLVGPAPPGLPAWVVGPVERVRFGRTRPAAFAVLTALLLVPSIPVTWSAMLNPVISNQFGELGVRYIISEDGSSADTRAEFDAYNDTRAVARWLDAQNLPRGSVLTDTYHSYGIWLASRRPDQFVITSDYDFLIALDSPAESGIQYILASNPEYDNFADAINVRYPTLWNDGAGLSTRELSVVQRGGTETWRIYRVIRPDHGS